MNWHYLNLTFESSHSDQPLPAFCAFIVVAGLVLLAVLKGPRTKVVRMFSLNSFFIGCWAFGIYQLTVATNADQGLFWVRILNGLAAFIPPTFFHFAVLLTETEKDLATKRALIFGYGVALMLLLLSPTSLFVKGTVPKPHFFYYPSPGVFFYPYMVFHVSYVLWAFIRLIKRLRSAPPHEANSVFYVILAYILGFGGGLQTFLVGLGLPMWKYAMDMVPIGLSLIFYAIIARQLMDIRIVIRKTLLYSVVTAGSASVYAGVVTLLSRTLDFGPVSNGHFSAETFLWLGRNLNLSFAYSSIATAIFSLGFGLFVLLKGIHKPVNRLWFLTTASVALWCLGMGMMVRSSDAMTANMWQEYVDYLGSIMIPIFFLHFVTLVVNQKFRFLLYSGYFAALLLEGLNLTGHLISVRIQPPFNFYTQPLPTYGFFVAYFFALVLIAHWLLLRNMFTDDIKLRNQCRYIFLGTFVGFAGGSTTFFPVYNIPIFPYGDYAVPIYILTVSYAIFKHQLMDISVVIRKTLIYSMISAALAAIYVGTITLLTHVLEGRQAVTSAYSSALAAIFITLLFNPLRSRIQKVIDKVFSRTRLDLEGKMAEFSSAVVGEQDPVQVTQALFRALTEGFNPIDMALYERDGTNGDYQKIYSLRPNWPAIESDDVGALTRNVTQSQPFVVASQKDQWRDAISRARVAVVVPLKGRGEWIGCLLIGEKRSEEMYSEEDLALLGIMANQAAVIYERPRLIREVSGSFVHEVKTPLSKISLPAELTFLDIEKAREGEGVSDELLDKIQNRMKYIMEQSAVAGHRVDALRELSANDEHRHQRIDVKSLFEKSLNAMDEMLQRLSVKTEIEAPNDLPVILGDAEQLEIVFVNLIKNAAEAMSELPAGKPRELGICARVTNNRVSLQFCDTGPGIKPENIERIFQSHFSTKGSNGTGMGLFLCREIVTAHGGTIAVRSTPGEGSEFVIRLPTK
jgi:two-component system NtrC family sensor kinase